jgi:hypothetical protein
VGKLRPRGVSTPRPGFGVWRSTGALIGTSTGRGTLAVTAEIADTCAALTPARVVARRSGQTIAGTLAATGRCRHADEVSVPDTGRWFLYVELREAGRGVEAWLPVDAQGVGAPAGEVAFGALLYAVGGLLLALTVLQLRRLASTRHASATSRSSVVICLMRGFGPCSLGSRIPPLEEPSMRKQHVVVLSEGSVPGSTP